MKKAMLYTPFDLNGTQLKNRIVMAPMGRSRATEADHTANDLLVEYYRQRAGAGLIITEGVLISEAANGGLRLPGIYNDLQIESWKKVTEAVHQEGGKIFLQLWHTGRLSHPKFLNGSLPKGPSVLPFQSQVYTDEGFEAVPQGVELTTQEMKEIIQDFARAAKNAILAGFDGVEIQGGNGYLVHQFISKYSNQRTDEYGGSIENRGRFLLEIIKAIEEYVPLNRLGVRLNPMQHNILGMELDNEAITIHKYFDI